MHVNALSHASNSTRASIYGAKKNFLDRRKLTISSPDHDLTLIENLEAVVKKIYVGDRQYTRLPER